MNVRFGNNEPPFPAELKHSFEWWFNQFWRECPDQERKAFYIEMLNPDGTVKNPAMTDAQKKDILGRMLRSGFTEFVSDYLESDDITLPGIRSGPNRVYVAFRGDFRTPAQVRLHEGTYAKASIPALRDSMNMSAPWHPFSDPSTRMKLYFRKYNADNCLFTVVSVAEDFATATKFPLMCDMEERQFGTAAVTARGYASEGNVRALAARFGGSVQPSPQSLPAGVTQKLLRASRISVYVVKTDLAYNTRRLQNAGPLGSPFPERAVRGIPWGHHVARVRIDRIHYGMDSNDGHLIIVHGFDWLHDRPTLARVLGGSAAVGTLEQYLLDLHRQGALVGGIGGMSFKTAASDPAVQIERVLRTDLTGTWE